MTSEQIMMMFSDKTLNYEYIHDERIKPERRLHRRPDLNAFLLLDRLCPGKHDIVVAAEHDKIFLSVEVESLSAATEEDILDLMRCGVRYDSGSDSLAMFV
jgi:hypothetical protein